MFTGIVEEIGEIASVHPMGGGRRISIRAKMVPELHVDQSVSVNGACQTVVEVKDELFSVVAVEETLRKTTFGGLKPGDSVNLERAVALGARLDGHMVQGHVDTPGAVVGLEVLEASRLYTIAYPAAFAPYLIPVGSVSVDGISLTVARLEGDTFTVAVIPYTYAHTNVQTWEVGTPVNLEFDLIGKYVARQRSLAGPPTPHEG